MESAAQSQSAAGLPQPDLSALRSPAYDPFGSNRSTPQYRFSPSGRLGTPMRGSGLPPPPRTTDSAPPTPKAAAVALRALQDKIRALETDRVSYESQIALLKAELSASKEREAQLAADKAKLLGTVASLGGQVDVLETEVRRMQREASLDPRSPSARMSAVRTHIESLRSGGSGKKSGKGRSRRVRFSESQSSGDEGLEVLSPASVSLYSSYPRASGSQPGSLRSSASSNIEDEVVQRQLPFVPAVRDGASHSLVARLQEVAGLLQRNRALLSSSSSAAHRSGGTPQCCSKYGVHGSEEADEALADVSTEDLELVMRGLELERDDYEQRASESSSAEAMLRSPCDDSSSVLMVELTATLRAHHGPRVVAIALIMKESFAERLWSNVEALGSALQCTQYAIACGDAACPHLTCPAEPMIAREPCFLNGIRSLRILAPAFQDDMFLMAVIKKPSWLATLVRVASHPMMPMGALAILLGAISETVIRAGRSIDFDMATLRVAVARYLGLLPQVRHECISAEETGLLFDLLFYMTMREDTRPMVTRQIANGVAGVLPWLAEEYERDKDETLTRLVVLAMSCLCQFMAWELVDLSLVSVQQRGAMVMLRDAIAADPTFKSLSEGMANYLLTGESLPGFAVRAVVTGAAIRCSGKNCPHTTLDTRLSVCSWCLGGMFCSNECRKHHWRECHAEMKRRF
eukprot:m51a1_g117 hypothetical protein (692) ;mRNA; r:359061-361893